MESSSSIKMRIVDIVAHTNVLPIFQVIGIAIGLQQLIYTKNMTLCLAHHSIR